MNDENKNPVCFGDLKKVFPLKSNGLRMTPDECLRCVHKTECLRFAMQGGRGLRVREEMIDRAYRGGVIGFFQRWSQKKTIQRMRKQEPS
ncbi:MAG: hypothetical protein VR64_08150 [Desulfatitalea sp. BRH_c12]|nr:MAG: hypothetical protein VR64_08150 [Desulfatitalea sp. BRH_c12]